MKNFITSLLACLSVASHGFLFQHNIKAVTLKSSKCKMSMNVFDSMDTISFSSDTSQWIQYTSQGIAGALEAASLESKVVVCPDFGQPGWAPFCFLNGNPIFNTFDAFQAFIQNAIVSLHDLLQVHK